MKTYLKNLPEDTRSLLEEIQDQRLRQDALLLCQLMQKYSGFEPRVWGGSIVGFGSYDLQDKDSLDWFLTGFSVNPARLCLLVHRENTAVAKRLEQLELNYDDKSGICITTLAEKDQDALAELIKLSVEAMREKYRKHAAS